MRIGIDFDNTIACYDELFHRVCREAGLIPASVPRNKSDVRNHLRASGREDDWTEIQGLVYGPRITEADPFPGVVEFIAEARDRGIPVAIISHKTRHPFRGEKHDLHAAARSFLAHHGIEVDQVFLEPTKEAKAERIRAEGCSHFIDDLPEFLELVRLSVEGRRILFDPNDLYADREDWWRLPSWAAIREAIL